MTDKEIDQLLAGNEIDRLISERVFHYAALTSGELRTLTEWADFQNPHCRPSFDLIFRNPEGKLIWSQRWSTDIAAAWRVVEKTQEEGKLLILSNANRTINEKTWKAGFYLDLPNPVPHLHRISETDADTAPLAICRAALKAVNK